MTGASEPGRLGQLYATHAARWHASITRLGYPDAYARLTRCDLQRRAAPARQVLDAGCGTGAFAEAYLSQSPGAKPALTALDPSPEMLDQARSRLAPWQPDCRQGQLEDLTRLSARFDTVLCAHVVEHVADLGAALEQLRAALLPGGSLLLSVSKPHWCTALLRWRWGHRAYRPEQVCAALAHHGFGQIEPVRYVKGPPSRTSCGYRAVRK